MTRPTDPASFKAVRSCLMDIVTLSLDENPALLPSSALKRQSQSLAPSANPNLSSSPASPDPGAPLDPSPGAAEHTSGDPPDSPVDDSRDPDDFAIMDEKQARRIVALCEAAFDVEMTVDVVVADANVSALAKRVMGARSLVRPAG